MPEKSSVHSDVYLQSRTHTGSTQNSWQAHSTHKTEVFSVCYGHKTRISYRVWNLFLYTSLCRAQRETIPSFNVYRSDLCRLAIHHRSYPNLWAGKWWILCVSNELPWPVISFFFFRRARVFGIYWRHVFEVIFYHVRNRKRTVCS